MCSKRNTFPVQGSSCALLKLWNADILRPPNPNQCIINGLPQAARSGVGILRWPRGCLRCKMCPLSIACRRRREAEPESSDDDEHFQKKEARRLDRDTGAQLFLCRFTRLRGAAPSTCGPRLGCLQLQGCNPHLFLPAFLPAPACLCHHTCLMPGPACRAHPSAQPSSTQSR